MTRLDPSHTKRSQKQDPSIPWMPLLLLLISIYLFWILPVQWGDAPVRVEFADKE